MFAKQYGTLRSAYISLTNGVPSATWFTATAGQRAFIFDIILTTNDSAGPLITLSGASTGVISRYYVINSAPLLDGLAVPLIVNPGDVVTIAANAITVAKTVECKCVYTLNVT